ncbi:HAD family hydrolase [Thermococcus gorgonarius]|uniref:Hydrolase n=1 Tax=Thermococcus gorgonarius TaxID=71997 RepID=A0A2Z2M4Q2_THEGO|nr:HAD family hydrolase [Thermococcus gorgonarius]ASI99982.1 hydrolase [Thermococcus gorgonarius]
MLVIVDLDDTLCNTWEAGKKTLLKVIMYALRRRKFRLIKYFLFREYRKLENFDRYHTMDVNDIIREVLTRIYPGIQSEEVEEITSLVEKEFFSRLRLYPDALPFLRALRKMGARVVLVTDSSSEWQRKKLKMLGIEGFFDDVIISGETGYSKLTPHNFKLAVSKFGDDKVYVVGDRDETDMAGAKAIGAVGILVRRGYFRGRPSKNADYVVHDLFEALEVIRNARGDKN